MLSSPRRRSSATEADRQPSALVLRVAGRVATVRAPEGDREAWLPSPTPGGPAVAGDRVAIERRDADELAVTKVLPRATVLLRGDGTARRSRPMVANADLLLVAAAVVDPPLRPRLLDRYLVAAELGGMDAAIVVTKTDLPHDASELAAVCEVYRDIGYDVLVGSAVGPVLPAEVRALIGDGVGALVGHSGVGKSTLVATMTGQARAVGAISRKAGTGRHTTTDPRLLDLPGGGMVADTAGVRTFHLQQLGDGDLERGFREIAAAAAGCRFRGCRHIGEDGCAVETRVAPSRLDSYRRLLTTSGALTRHGRPA
jgi:ribosome biogenesis GTPase